jgi:hypothetical protein
MLQVPEVCDTILECPNHHHGKYASASLVNNGKLESNSPAGGVGQLDNEIGRRKTTAEQRVDDTVNGTMNANVDVLEGNENDVNDSILETSLLGNDMGVARGMSDVSNVDISRSVQLKEDEVGMCVCVYARIYDLYVCVYMRAS